MGLIKKILGAVLGVFAAIAGLVGLGKKDAYYLDLSGAETPAAASQVAAAPAPAASSAATAKATTAKGATPQAAPAAPAPKVAKVQTPEELIAAAVSAKIPGQGRAGQGGESISFTDYMSMPLPTGRRRPGGSLAIFKDMAKDVTPRSLRRS